MTGISEESPQEHLSHTWVTFAEAHATELMSFIGAQHFLCHILNEATVFQSFTTGRWGE